MKNLRIDVYCAKLDKIVFYKFINSKWNVDGNDLRTETCSNPLEDHMQIGTTESAQECVILCAETYAQCKAITYQIQGI